jgi:phosphoglycerate dehydrogenase-like enzyme
MPHCATVSPGNDARAAEIFIGNFTRWARGEPMAHQRSG